MNYLVQKLFILMLGLFIGLSGCTQANPDLKNIVQNGATLIDVRTPQEFAEGSAEGAINIPLSQIENRISDLKNKENIVVFCRSGNRSGKALKILKESGISNVTNGGTWLVIKKIQENSEN